MANGSWTGKGGWEEWTGVFLIHCKVCNGKQPAGWSRRTLQRVYQGVKRVQVGREGGCNGRPLSESERQKIVWEA